MAKRSRARTPWIIGGLIVFVLADLALVGFALRGPADDSSVSAVAPDFTFTPTPSESAATPSAAPSAAPSSAPSTAPATSAPSTPAPSGTPTPGATSAAPAAALTGMASATVGYRATAGTCSGNSTSTDSVIELTTDGGATWTKVNPTDIRIRAVEKINVVDASHVDVLARYGDNCTRSDVTTYTQGEFWQVYPDRTALFD
ncbi:hypothetical protein C5B96_08865 [Subtercola sp. Z020]|uniref:hypothetical protein n=1 Tax=Subtercola sp. Z020 TaxID=2080582 RepID=UPI000CE789E7|nr:hypothetical protein [Subtercola sp. Z020]PPF82738.1 hypothetical protein C5B96_08865 [Subtercola sp. Z020]